MGESKPCAERFSAEVDAFFRLWKNRRWLAIVFILIVISVCVYFSVGWYRRGNRIETLTSENRELKRDVRQLESETKGLRETVAPLIARAAKEFPGEEINTSLKKIVDQLEKSSPIKKPISSAEATVEVTIKSDASVNTNYIDSGGYAMFGKGSTALLRTSSRESSARQTGKGAVVYRAVFTMPADDQAVGKPIEDLKEAEYIQAYFFQMPTNSLVMEGKIIFVINDSTRLEFAVSEQQTVDRRFFVRNLAEGLTPLASNN